MPRKKRRFSREFKARVALEAFKEQQPLVQLAAKYEVHPNQITKWKREAQLRDGERVSDLTARFSRTTSTLRGSVTSTSATDDRSLSPSMAPTTTTLTT